MAEPIDELKLRAVCPEAAWLLDETAREQFGDAQYGVCDIEAVCRRLLELADQVRARDMLCASDNAEQRLCHAERDDALEQMRDARRERDEALAEVERLTTPMDCGHPAAGVTSDEDGTSFCAVCNDLDLMDECRKLDNKELRDARDAALARVKELEDAVCQMTEDMTEAQRQADYWRNASPGDLRADIERLRAENAGLDELAQNLSVHDAGREELVNELEAEVEQLRAENAGLDELAKNLAAHDTRA